MKELKKELKISPSLREQEKISYASDVINVPEGGIDCNEGCNPYGFPPALEEAMADLISSGSDRIPTAMQSTTACGNTGKDIPISSRRTCFWRTEASAHCM